MTALTLVTEPAPFGSRGETLAIGAFRTGHGAVIEDAVLRYRVFGDREAARRNGWILVFHALTGSADVDDWWEPLVGPGRPLEP